MESTSTPLRPAWRNFIVFADRFHENTGGVLVLHRLCDLLNRAGETAFLWPARKPLWDPSAPWASAWAAFRYHRRRWRKPYKTRPGFVTPIATEEDLPGAVVVYPEIVYGNPLRAENVVRWLLHKPGFHKGTIGFGPDDRFFFAQPAFNDPKLNPDESNLLKMVVLRDDMYRQTNFGPRHGTCYFLRKGKGRPIVHDLTDSQCVDGLSHEQLVEVFNRVEMCISYDPYTVYSYYAALCGCVSVIVPMEGISKEQWYPDPCDRLGVAYGFDDLEHARRTTPDLLAYLRDLQSPANPTVQHFIAQCRRYFPLEEKSADRDDAPVIAS